MFTKQANDFFIRRQAQSTQQYGCRQFSSSIYTSINNIVDVGFILNPRTTVRNNGSSIDFFAARIHIYSVVNARRTNQLAYDNTFSTIDYESTGFSHQGEIAHKYGRFFDFASIFVHQAYFNIHRSRVRFISFLAFLNIIFRFAKLEVFKRKLKVTGKVFNRRNVVENFTQTFFNEPVIRAFLNINQMRHGPNFIDTSIAVPNPITYGNRFKHVITHPFIFLHRHAKTSTANRRQKKQGSYHKDLVYCLR